MRYIFIQVQGKSVKGGIKSGDKYFMEGKGGEP